MCATSSRRIPLGWCHGPFHVGTYVHMRQQTCADLALDSTGHISSVKAVHDSHAVTDSVSLLRVGRQPSESGDVLCHQAVESLHW